MAAFALVAPSAGLSCKSATVATAALLNGADVPVISAGVRRSALTFCGDSGVVQLAGLVVENPHGLHLNTFRFSAKARLIVCSRIIGRSQNGQMTSFVDVGPSLIMCLCRDGEPSP
jgi:hypothetical protein